MQIIYSLSLKLFLYKKIIFFLILGVITSPSSLFANSKPNSKTVLKIGLSGLFNLNAPLRCCQFATATGYAYKICPLGNQYYSATVTAKGCGDTCEQASQAATANAIQAASTKATTFAAADY